MATQKDSLKEPRRRGAPTKAEKLALKRAAKEAATNSTNSSTQKSFISELQNDIDKDIEKNISNTEVNNTPIVEDNSSSMKDEGTHKLDTDDSSSSAVNETNTNGGEPTNGSDDANVNSNSSDNDIPFSDFDPLSEPVIKRGYTATASPTNPVDEAPIPEPQIKSQQPFAANQPNSNLGSDQPKSEKPPKENINPKMDDLSPNQKRKAAETTADALIATYATVLPIPFQKISSFNIVKMKKLAMDGKIDMTLQIIDDGTRVIDYVEGTNKQVETLFTVTEDMQEEIKEPLVDVLLENNFALTPTQRLLMAIGGHVVTFTVKAFELIQQKNQAMEQFQKFHQDNLDFKRNTNFNVAGNQQQQQATPPKQEQHEPSSTTKKNTPSNEEKESVGSKKTVEMDDILSVENGGIEVSEE